MAELQFSNPLSEPVGGAHIKVIGIGGGGCNAINNMVNTGLASEDQEHAHGSVEFISANTDAQALKMSLTDKRIQLGIRLTQGLGAGANPEIGRRAAEEAREAIEEALEGAHMVFITTGMGGGTGTGAAPVVAEVAKKLGILTVAVVTRPFAYEGKRQKVAQSGIEVLKEHVDSLIVIPNDKLLDSLGQDITLREAFKAADDVLCSAVTGITEIVTRPGLINIDFADIRNVMSIAGVAMMGSAEASGPDRARTATEQAISSPLLDNTSLDGARGVLVSITTAPHCLKMSEYQEVMRIIDDSAASDVDVKYGTAEDPTLDEDTIRVTLVATGLQEANAQQPNLSIRQKTGTDDAVAGGNGFGGVIQSGRSGRGRTRGLNLTAESFKDNAILDDFEIPTAIRRQAD